MTQTHPSSRPPAALPSYSPRRGDLLGRALLLVVAAAVLLVSLPVMIEGAPLHDDYLSCLSSQEGLVEFLGETTDFYGLVRPARLLEISTISGLCHTVPFGFVIAIPLALTLLCALLLRRLLLDLDIPAPWPHVAASAWLLYPLGTESSLWPSALHIPLGLCFSLAALLCFRRARVTIGVLLTFASVLSMEQLLFALPIAAFLVSPRPTRRKATIASGIVCLFVLSVYAAGSGQDPRAATSVADRFRNVFSGLDFYVLSPPAALGGYSVPAGVLWAFPWSLIALVAGGAFGAFIGRQVAAPARYESAPLLPAIAWGLALLAAVNLPLAVTLPHQDSPRVFAPTWMILAVGIGVLGPRLLVRRGFIVAALAGMLAAGALISQAFSVWVRVETATSTERAFTFLSERVPEGGVIAMCNVQRSVIDGAPPGDFAAHEFLGDGTLQTEFAEPAFLYHSGRRAEFRLPGLQEECPDTEDADIVVDFARLLSP